MAVEPVDCRMEAEILAAIAEARWPAGVAAELRDHAAACPACSDLIAVAAAVLNEKRELRSTAALPDAGQVWWRAQLRARREAAEAAGRPITAAQLVAFGCAVGLL